MPANPRTARDKAVFGEERAQCLAILRLPVPLVVTQHDVEAVARDYIGTLRSHMRLEEDEILPLADQLLTPRDWKAIHAAIGDFEDPLFGKHTEARYVALHRQISRQAAPAGDD